MTKPTKLSSNGNSTRRPRRSSQEVVERILEAAAVEFEQSGYSGATTAAIARRAEVTEAQIFRSFASKQALFRAAIFGPLNRHFEDFQSRIEGSLGVTDGVPGPGHDLAHQYIDELQGFMADHSRMFMSLIVASAYGTGGEGDDAGNVAEMEGLRAYFDRGTALMKARAGGEAKVPPELMVRVSFAAVLANLMFRDWLFPAGIATDAQIREAIAAFVIEGIEANGPVG